MPDDINWYPGHMAKTKRLLQNQIRMVDAVIELCDARAPYATRNPDLRTLTKGKAHILVLNKSDLAQESVTQKWLSYYRSKGLTALRFQSTGNKIKEILTEIDKCTQSQVNRMMERGARKTVRLMVIGIPNVGKSTFVNRLKGQSIVQTADRPGVTRTNTWVKIGPYLELLDTPGLLWPKLSNQDEARTLAFLGSIKDQVMDSEDLACHLLERLMQHAPKETIERFKLPESVLNMDDSIEHNSQASESIVDDYGYEQPSVSQEVSKGYRLLEMACRSRGWIMSGNRLDTERGSALILDEFRAGKIGKISLEYPIS